MPTFSYTKHLPRIFIFILLLLPILFPSRPIYAAGSYQGDDPALECAKGVEFFFNNQFQIALPLLESGIANRENAKLPWPPNLLGMCAFSLGKLYTTAGRTSESLNIELFALEEFRGNGNRILEGATLNEIGAVYHILGSQSKAIEYFLQALEIDQEIGARAEEGPVLNNLGLAYFEMGHYELALDYYHQALKISYEMDDLYGAASTLNNIGMVYANQGRFPEALSQYQASIKVLENISSMPGNEPMKNLGAFHLSIEGTTLVNIGNIYLDSGQYEDALKYFERALVIFKGLDDTWHEAATLNSMGLIYVNNKDQYTKAIEKYKQALAIYRENRDRDGESIVLNNIGLAYYLQEQYSEALPYFEQSLVLARETENLLSEGKTLYNLSNLYYLLGEEEKSLASLEQSLLIFENMRAVAGSDIARSSFIGQYTDLYDSAVELYYIQGKSEAAFLATERGRARSFLDSLSSGKVALNDNEAEKLYQSEQESYAMLQLAKEALAKAKKHTPPDEKLIANLEEQLSQANINYKTALDAIKGRNDQLLQLVPGQSDVLDAQQVRNWLDNKTTLLSFWGTEDQTFAFVLTKDSLAIVPLNITRKELHEKINSFRSFVNLETQHPESAVELYKSIIEPLKPFLKNPNLIVVPHGELHYLPFAALTDGTRYLIDDYSITYLPSASAGSLIVKNTDRTNTDLFVIGNPDTDIAEMKSLPFAENEAKVIADLYQTRPLLNSNATESALRAQASQIGLLHIAAHGEYNPINPLYSALYLAPDATQDGALETHEIYGLNLNQTALVVLSACETQLGKLSSGDELVGLTRAFFFAGTPTVISALWEVDDQATEILMEKFYTNLQAGMTKKEALRQAQIATRTDYPNPYYWAGFVLNGDGDQTVMHIRASRRLPGNLFNCTNSISLGVLLIVAQTTKRKKLKRR